MKCVEKSNKELTTKVPLVSRLKSGECFLYNSKLYMKLEPRKFILNSHLIQDVVSRGDVFVVDLSTGVFTCFNRDTYIIPVQATCTYSRED